MQPLLSICIPTFNRASYLARTLEYLASQPEFLETGEVEIVVSDNASTDETESVCRAFVERYPDKIRYGKNQTNIRDLNYEKVLRMATGKLLKLHNDNLHFVDGALSRLLSLVRREAIERRVVFLSNGNFVPQTPTEPWYLTVDEFLMCSGHWKTWIASFTIWKQDLDSLEDFSRELESQLIQVDVTLRLLEKKRSEVLVVPQTLYAIDQIKGKGGYNIVEVFGGSYIELLKKHRNLIGEAVLRKEIDGVFLNMVLPWVARVYVFRHYKFDVGGLGVTLKKYYSFWERQRLYAVLTKEVAALLLTRAGNLLRKLWFPGKKRITAL